MNDVAPTPVDAPEQKKTLVVLVVAQVLSGAGLAAGITVGALLAQDMLGETRLAGLPIALFTIGSAAAAVMVGRISGRLGRRAGLAAGYVVGALGSLGVVLAASADNVPLLFAALFVYGAGTATNLQARYAGADLAAPARRGRAVSTVLVATTAGAVVGPNLVVVMGDVAASWGIPVLAGPFILAAASYGAAGIVLSILLRPDPLLVARERAAAERVARERAAAQRVPTAEHTTARHTTAATTPTPGTDATTDPPGDRRWSRGVTFGATVMVVAQIVMAAIMTMTPVHMQDHGHGTGAAGLVISIHVGAMFLPSPVSGWLVDRYGSRVVAALAGLTLLAAGLTAALAPVASVTVLAIGLALLGLGWSLGLVSGTAAITDAVPLAFRARAQGNVDVLIALAGAAGGAASGVVVAGSSYAAMSLGGGLLALLLVPLVASTRLDRAPVAD